MRSPDKTTSRKPSWLKVKAPLGQTYSEVKKLLGDLTLHTVCQEANCPNRLECWSKRTATFLILGERCTRACRFCNVSTGNAAPLDPDEPAHVAEAVRRMELKYAVVTSVTRDDLPDGGASHFAETVRRIKSLCPDVGVEVLIPDFMGSEDSLRLVMDSKPDVINHNLETVRSLTEDIRSGADYDRSLEMIRRVRELSEGQIRSKSGIMLGLGETRDEIRECIEDLDSVGCQLLTIGQYLAPSDDHHPVEKYYTPGEFEEIREMALGFGFESVLAGPLVRSSYHASELAGRD